MLLSRRRDKVLFVQDQLNPVSFELQSEIGRVPERELRGNDKDRQRRRRRPL